MLDHAREAYALIQHKSREDLDADRLLDLVLWSAYWKALVRQQAESPRKKRVHYPGIPWLQIVAMRNRLIHGYDVVDFEILWRTEVEDLPPLIVAERVFCLQIDPQPWAIANLIVNDKHMLGR